MASVSQINSADSSSMEEKSPEIFESSSEFEDSATAKALCIPWVLSGIANHLPVKDIAIIRCTATAWNAEFAPIMRRKWPMLTFHCDAKILRYLRTMKKSTSIPFGGYRLTTSRDYPAPSRDICTRFFAPPIGFSVVKLWLETCLWGHRGLRRVLLDWTPNLVELEIFCDGDLAEDSDDDEKLEPVNNRQWSNIPNLRKIDLTVPNVVDVTPSQATLELVKDLVRGAVRLVQFKAKDCRANGLVTAALETMAIYGGGGCLKKLIIDQPTQKDLRTLISLSRRASNPLKLRKFSYHSETPIENVGFCRTLSEFLSLQATTLEQLRIWTDDHSYPIWLPHMNRLHSFKMKGEFPATFERQTFALNYPNLLTLTLRDCIDLAPTFAHPHVTRFRFNLLGFDVTSVEALPLRLCFPSVVEVVIFMSHAGLLVPLWTTWPSLEVLRVDNAGDYEEEGEPVYKLDEIITGIPESQFETLRQAIENVAGAVADAQQNLAQFKIRAGISDLAELKEFHFEDCMGREHDPISDISDHFGFKLPGSRLTVCEINRRDRIHASLYYKVGDIL